MGQALIGLIKMGAEAELEYTMPALIGPHEGEQLTKDRFSPLIEVPAIINAKKLNTVLWSIAFWIHPLWNLKDYL